MNLYKRIVHNIDNDGNEFEYFEYLVEDIEDRPFDEDPLSSIDVRETDYSILEWCTYEFVSEITDDELRVFEKYNILKQEH